MEVGPAGHGRPGPDRFGLLRRGRREAGAVVKKAAHASVASEAKRNHRFFDGNESFHVINLDIYIF